MNFREFGIVWNGLIRFKLPQSDGSETNEPNRLLLAYPAVGLALGAALAVVGFLIRQLVPRPVAAALVGGIAIPLLLLWLVRNRGFLAVCTLADRLYEESDGTEPEGARQLTSMLPMGWLVLTMFAAGVLVFDAAYGWLLLVPMFATTAQAEVMFRSGILPLNADEEQPVYPMHWLGAVVAALVVAMIEAFLGPAVLGLLATWTLTLAALRLGARCPDRSHTMWLAFALVELAAVWLGVFTW